MNDPATVVERWLSMLLPEGWTVRTLRSRSTGYPSTTDITSPEGRTRRLHLAVIEGHPSDVANLAAIEARDEVLAVAQWLGPRMVETLGEHRLNYVDDTGNVRLVLNDPTTFILRTGSPNEPSERHETMLRRLKPIRLMRFLVDHAPKQGVSELAEATDISAGYLSQVMKALEAKGLIRRGRAGRVEQIFLDGLLQQLAASYEPVAFSDAYTFVGDRDQAAFLKALREMGPQAVVTGATAAAMVTHAAPASTVSVYVDDPLAVAASLDLTRVRHHGDIVLLKPLDAFLTQGAWEIDGLWLAAVPQIVIDCFANLESSAGNAMLRWSLANVPRWRTPVPFAPPRRTRRSSDHGV